MKKRMYQRGVAIADMNDLADQIRQGRYMYWLDKPMHPSFVNNMTMNTVRGAIARGILSYALPYTEEKGGEAVPPIADP